MEGEKEEAKKNKIKVKDWIVMHPEPKQTDSDYQLTPKRPKPTLAQLLEEEEWEDTESEGECSDNEAESDESDG